MQEGTPKSNCDMTSKVYVRLKTKQQQQQKKRMSGLVGDSLTVPQNVTREHESPIQTDIFLVHVVYHFRI